jgi:quercetin dioxygenase-like cupin family protein
MNSIPVPDIVRRDTAEKLPVFGVEVEVLIGVPQIQSFGAYIATCGAGTGAPPHRHVGQDEAFFVLEGAFDVLLGERVQRLNKGDFAMAPRGIVHGFTAAAEGSSKLLVYGTPAGHEAFFRDCAAAIKAGTFSPERGQAICQKHGIELIGRPA